MQTIRVEAEDRPTTIEAAAVEARRELERTTAFSEVVAALEARPLLGSRRLRRWALRDVRAAMMHANQVAAGNESALTIDEPETIRRREDGLSVREAFVAEATASAARTLRALNDAVLDAIAHRR